MRCESCGYENDIDAQYCEKCGTNLNQQSGYNDSFNQKQEKKGMKPLTKVLIVTVIVLVGVLGVTAGILMQSNNVNTIANNSQVTVSQPPAQVNSQADWHEVTTIKNPTKGTVSFNIQGEKCKIVISAEPIVNYEENILVVDLFKDNVAVASPYVSWTATETPSSKEDTAVSSAGPGNYEVKIIPNNLEKWSIKVYDYY